MKKSIELSRDEIQILREAMSYMQDMENDLALDRIEAVDLTGTSSACYIVTETHRQHLREEITATIKRAVVVNVLAARIEALV